ncbi:hypothetical protein vseg_006323 [Gypsophila vaccaria]
MASTSEEEQQTHRNDDVSSSPNNKHSQNDVVSVVVHKTKTIEFFGRTSPIVLQHDNGPCPLLAICNVLLLRNQLNLNVDIGEVSQEKLLSLVAEKLIDSNSNVDNKDAEYVENQQQNIADAIDLLPELTTGIDVNTKFRRIDDFEFTRECAIFDLLDIPLYHGWLVDPQDHDTADAIGSKSYNAITSDLVFLETRKMENEGKNRTEEDCVDFAAATTATLGAPSPNHSRVKSSDFSSHSVSDQHGPRKGDVEEEAELLRCLKISENETLINCPTTSSENVSCSDENLSVLQSTLANNEHVTEAHSHTDASSLEPSVSGCTNVSGTGESNDPLEDHGADRDRQNDKTISVIPSEGSFSSDDLATCPPDTPISCEATPLFSIAEAKVPCEKAESLSSVTDSAEELHKQSGENGTPVAGLAGSESSSGKIPSVEAAESCEGEECMPDSSKIICNREPVYEGEMILADQAGKGAGNAGDESSQDAMTLRHGELIANFLKSNASQLTFYGLFCLQRGLRERELCVFFRNNHFSTMFKFQGELYILATDQGYLNQPDLVWEKLNEVNGDTMFMTCNFKEFGMERNTNSTWNQQNAVASTADYLASIDSSSPDDSNMTSDMQLAIALQQQEFEQQQPQRDPSQQPPAANSSRLIVGPQVSTSSGRATSSASKQDQKSKDKSSNCKLM